MMKIHALVCRTLSPAPPCDRGEDRNPGSQVFSPQYAKSMQVASAVVRNVRLARGGRKRSSHGLTAGFAFHKGGSCTLRWIQIVRSAGSNPVRNSTRHPKRGRMNAVLAAASM